MRRLLVTLFAIGAVIGNPMPRSKNTKNSADQNDKERVLYDQRQEGESNIRVDLSNIVVLLFQKEPLDTTASTGASLLDLMLTRSHAKLHGKRTRHPQKPSSSSNEVAGVETKHFIESKTAPYHVDITKTDDHLMNDEILATQTPPVTITKGVEEATPKSSSTEDVFLRQLRSTKLAKAFVLTVPEDEFVLTRMEDDKDVVKKDGIKKKLDKNVQKEEMMLLGALEQCGPDMERDDEGVCRLKFVQEDSTQKRR